MRLAYMLVFLVLATVCIFGGVAVSDIVGWPAIIFGYAAVSFLMLSIAYGGAGPELFGKRASGQHSIRSWLLFSPYFLLNAVIFRLHRGMSREPAYAEVVPNLFFGRRLTEREANEARALGWIAVLDLAPEFAESPALRILPGYRTFPILDATAPTEPQLHDAVRWLTDAVVKGPVYIHCALGHGRTGCVVVAYLLAAGVVNSVAEGVRLMRTQRPGVRLNRPQLRALRLLKIPGAGFPK